MNGPGLKRREVYAQSMSKINVSDPPEVTNFLDYLRVSNYSGKSIVNYRLAIVALIEYLGRRRSICDVMSRDLDKFVAYLRRNGMKTSSVRTYMSMLNVYFRWLYARGEIAHVPERTLQLRMSEDERREERRWLKAEDVIAFRQHVAKMTTQPYWRASLERVVIELLISTGARANELASLEVARCDFNGQLLQVYGKKTAETARNKGGTGWRPIPMRGKVFDYLQDWLTVRPESGPEVFPDINVGSIQYIVSKLAKQMGMVNDDGKPWVTPHLFRHYFATELAEKGVNIVEIADLMGDDPLTVRKNYIHRTNRTHFSEGVLS